MWIILQEIQSQEEVKDSGLEQSEEQADMESGEKLH